MNRLFISTVLVGIIFFSSLRQVFAMGAFVTNGLPQTALTETKIIVILDGTKENLIVSNTFSVNPLIIDNFAWIIATPSKPEVSILKDDIFVQLDKLTEKKFTKDNLWEKALYFDIAEEESQPTQTFTHPAYIKNPVIFTSKENKKLQQWLYEMGDFIPKNSQTLYKSYLNKNWYFVGTQVDAVHIEMDATDSLLMSGAHTTPISISFNSEKSIIPLKFSTIQPDRDSNAVPLSFPYGSSSEAILGAKDERVDDLLATPSGNRYPPLPLDFAHVKVELFIFDTHKMAVKGFTTASADWIDGEKYSLKDPKGRYHWRLPEKKMFLTHLFAYKPLSQLEDVSIEPASNNSLVNPSISFIQTLLRGGLFFIILFILVNQIKKNRKKS